MRSVRNVAPLLTLLLCAHLIDGSTVASSQVTATRDPRFERIASAVSERMRELGIPGVVLGISEKGERRTRAFGVTSSQNPLPVTDDTLFQVGSITKTFTGTAVMRLVEAGKLSLSAPVRDYLPTFRVKDETASRRTTLLTLLTHMGGWEGDLIEDFGSGDDALGRAVARMEVSDQVAPFNTLWSYNNSGFYAAGRLIELATGKPYETAIKDLVLDPLGLNQTYFFPSDVMTYRFAVGHVGPTDNPQVARPWPIPRNQNPAGGIATNVNQLLGYAGFHLGDGTAPGGARLLSSESLRRMHDQQVVKHGTDEGMAIAWQISSIGGWQELWHDGATNGQQSLLSLIPSRQLAVVLLTNSVRGERMYPTIRAAVAQTYLGITLPPVTPTTVPDAELAQYVGRFSRPASDVVVTKGGSGLMIQMIRKQGFTPNTPPPPPSPPTAYAFYAKDRLLGPDGFRVEFLRLPDGRVGWIRVFGRVARRQGIPLSP